MSSTERRQSSSNRAAVRSTEFLDRFALVTGGKVAIDVPSSTDPELSRTARKLV
jgi:hypothetical protein